MPKRKSSIARPLSIVDLAAELGVSHMTISRVINGQPGVSEALAAQIRQRMREIGYQPRAVRPGPRRREAVSTPVSNGVAHGGRRGVIGFIQLGDGGPHRQLPTNTIYVALAASQAAAAADYDMLFAEVVDAPTMPGWLRDGRADGLLLAGYHRDNALMAHLSSFPCVWLSSHPAIAAPGESRPIRDRVLSGNRAAGKVAAEYLVRRGHRLVATLNPLAGWQVLETRCDAFELTARRGNATVSRLELASGPDEVIFSMAPAALEARVAQLADRLAAIPPAERPTGLFLPDAPIALAFYRCAPSRGLVVGRDVDVISFGLHPGYAGLSPTPAYVGVGESLRGTRAVNQLLWRIANPKEAGGVEVSIDPELVEGELPWPPPRG